MTIRGEDTLNIVRYSKVEQFEGKTQILGFFLGLDENSATISHMIRSKRSDLFNPSGPSLDHKFQVNKIQSILLTGQGHKESPEFPLRLFSNFSS